MQIFVLKILMKKREVFVEKIKFYWSSRWFKWFSR